MEKLDYSDINKFLASLWVVLVWVSLLIPYFYLKEDFWFLINTNDYKWLLPWVQNIILNKYYYLEKLQIIIPVLSLLTFLSWITSFYIWIKRWNKNQQQLDKKLAIDIEKGDLEVIALRPQTKKETEEDKKNEVIDDLGVKDEPDPANKPSKNINYPERINNYIRIENMIAGLFKSFKSDDYTIFSQQRIDNRINVDVLLQSSKKSLSDAIVEIKYLSTLNIFHAKRILDSLNSIIAYYKNKSGKFCIPILIIAWNDDIKEEDIIRLESYINEYKKGLPDIASLITKIIPESKIQELDVSDIISEVYDKSQLDIIHKKMAKIAGRLFRDNKN